MHLFIWSLSDPMNDIFQDKINKLRVSFNLHVYSNYEPFLDIILTCKVNSSLCKL